MRVNVVFIIPAFHPATYWGGSAVSVLSLCNLLASLESMDLEVVTTDASGAKRTHSAFRRSRSVRYPAGYNVHFYPGLFGTDISPAMLFALWGRIRKADVVHLSGVYSPPTMPALMACRLFRKPLVWSPHGSWQRWERSTRVKSKRVWDRVCRAIAPKRLVLHTTSKEEAQATMKRFPGVQVVVLPNGVDVPRDVAQVEECSPLRIVYLGRLDPKKGIENLMSACKRLNDIEWCLIMAGSGHPGYVRQLKNRISELGFVGHEAQTSPSLVYGCNGTKAGSGHMTLIGEVEGLAKKTLFENAHIVVVPSFTENFGMVVAEALAHGVPVIASTGTPWQRVEEIGCGLWVNNDPETLAKAIEQMSKMSLREMGSHGRNWMQREFSWSDRAKEMRALYQSLVSS
jgi:glycosyltransferase involved in cell wall biosynthesis